MTTTTTTPPPPKSIHLVIARYGETLSWLRDPPFNQYPYFVYNKSPTNDSSYYHSPTMFLGEMHLPNVGKEAHTYLYHIVHRYDNPDATLADITIFLPGSVGSPNLLTRAQQFVRMVGSVQHSVFSGWYERQPSHEFHRDPYWAWFEHMFVPHHPKTDLWNFVTYNSMIALTKDDIYLYKTKAFYETLLNQVSGHVNPEECYYMERAYPVLFSPLKSYALALPK